MTKIEQPGGNAEERTINVRSTTEEDLLSDMDKPLGDTRHGSLVCGNHLASAG